MTTEAAPSADSTLHDAQSRVDRLLADGRATEAAELAGKLTEIHSEDAWAWQRLAAALLATDGGQETNTRARQAAERGVTLDPTSAIGYRMLSEASLRLGDKDAALSTMRAAVQAAPDSWVAHLDLAAALTSRPGGAAEAVRIAQRATRLAPQRPEPHLVLGDLAQRAGDLSGAAASYADALDIEPGNARAAAKLAELHATMAQPEPPVSEQRPARLVGDGLAVLSGLTVLAAAMLLALSPGHPAGWFRTVELVVAGGLILTAAAVAASARKLFTALPVVQADRGVADGGRPGPAHAPRRGTHRAVTGPGYLAALVVSAACLTAAVLTVLGSGLVGGTTGLRVALCVALGGCAAGHLLARFADGAATAAPDGRTAGRMRSGAFFGLALGSLLHAVVFVALVLADTVLPPGAAQVVSVLVASALIFVAGMQYAALAGLAAAHRQRFGNRPTVVLVGVVAAGVVDLVGLAGALAVLFVPTPTALLLTGAFLALLVATVCALVAATMRR